MKKGMIFATTWALSIAAGVFACEAWQAPALLPEACFPLFCLGLLPLLWTASFQGGFLKEERSSLNGLSIHA